MSISIAGLPTPGRRSESPREREARELAERMHRPDLQRHLSTQAESIVRQIPAWCEEQNVHDTSMSDDKRLLRRMVNSLDRSIGSIDAVAESETAVINGSGATFAWCERPMESGDTPFRDALDKARASAIHLRDMAATRSSRPTWTRISGNSSYTVRYGKVEQRILRECMKVIDRVDATLLTETVVRGYVDFVLNGADLAPEISNDMIIRAIRAFRSNTHL